MREVKYPNNVKYRETPKGILTNIYTHQKQRRNVSYSLTELHDMFINDKRFLRLVDEWLKSGKNYLKKPTIDRINCKKGYMLDNIQCLTFEENRYKQRMELKILLAKKIRMLKDGVVVKRFKSVNQAVKETGLNQSLISSCLTKIRNHTGGYQFEYDTVGNIHEEELK